MLEVLSPVEDPALGIFDFVLLRRCVMRAFVVLMDAVLESESSRLSHKALGRAKNLEGGAGFPAPAKTTALII